MNTNNNQLDFAFIGHLDSWQTATDFVNSVRKPELNKLSIEQVREVFPFIPPRDVFRVKVKSETGAEINGVYIETFIDPDKLDERHLRTNIKKVKSAIEFAKKLEAKIVTLGGFTSIVLEGNFELHSSLKTKFSTGNTLTAAFIVKGIEEMFEKHKLKFSQSTVLIIGATGDIGLACTNFLKQKVKKLLLCSRKINRLEKLAGELTKENISVSYSADLNDLTPDADVIISVASSVGIKIGNCKKDVLICDAGYPKNLEKKTEDNYELNLFHGGMGHVSCGFDFNPDYSRSFYRYPMPHIAHGCILEAMVLAFENKFESYSFGKGNITTERMEEIYKASLKHGINLAPFYNSNGLLKNKVDVILK